MSLRTEPHNKYEERYRIMGLRIAYYRKKAGYTQVTFAEKIGCSVNFLAQVEGPSTIRGVSLEMLFKICDALHIQPGDLLDEDKEIK